MRILLILCMSLFSINTNAALINNDLYTTDTVTNLDWLDLSQTLGMTSYDVNSQISGHYDYDLHVFVPSNFMGGGWGFANEAQAIDLVTRNIGAGFGLYSVDSQESENASALMNLLGPTNSRPFTAGLFINNNNELNLIKIENMLHTLDNINYTDMEAIRYTNSFSWSSTGGTSVGKFLVREHVSAVPIPAPLFLFVSGFGLLFYRQIKHAANKYINLT